MLPIKDYVYIAAIIALLIGFGVFVKHERNIGEAKEVAALKVSSDKLQAAADAKVAQLTAQHATEVTTIKVNYENALTADSAQRASDAQRLRNFDAYRSAHSAVHSAIAGLDATGPVQGVTSADDSRTASLEQVALGLAAAGRSVSDSLTACVADRAALAGK